MKITRYNYMSYAILVVVLLFTASAPAQDTISVPFIRLNDSITETSSFYDNGTLNSRVVHYTPMSNPNISKVFEEYFYDREGSLTRHLIHTEDTTVENRYVKIEGAQDTNIVHFKIVNHILVCVTGENIEFVNRNGRLVDYAIFMSRIRTGQIEEWDYYVEFPQLRNECLKIIVYDRSFNLYNRRKFRRLKKLVIEKCY